MNYQHKQNLIPGSDGISKIMALCWSPNSLRLAVATHEKKLVLFDEEGNKRKTFSSKGHPQGTSAYVIKEIQFSGDSTRLAVAISDKAVYVYHLGETWGEDIKIKNKFFTNSPITCMHWCPKKTNEIQIGLAEGKVVSGIRKSNSTEVLYASENFIVSLASSPDGKYLLSGHVDGTIMKYNFENSQLQQLVSHSSIPYCLAWGNDIFAAGNNYKVSVYSSSGGEIQKFDYADDSSLKEFTLARMNHIGDTVVLGNYNKFFVFNYNSKKRAWEEGCIKKNEGLNSVCSLAWKPDGSTIATGNLSGSVDLFSAAVKTKLIRDKFEVSSLSQTQLAVKNTETGAKLSVKLDLSSEIKKINVFEDNFLLVTTAESIVLGDINEGKFSEIAWKPTGREKFDFSNFGIALVYDDEELALVEYGNKKLLGYCRTKFVKSSLISCRLSQRAVGLPGKTKKVKLLAYLSDIYTFKVIDLETNQEVCDVTHDYKIDFLDLSKNGNKLVFRDRKKQLFVYDVFANRKSTLLNFCGFVQWVPNSDVLVAQERGSVHVWYNIDDPDKVTVIAVKGSLEEIKRRQGKTELVVEEEGQNTSYLLDDGLISFSQALDESDIIKAVGILENLDNTDDTQSHWNQLAKVSIAAKNFTIAARCFAAAGSYSKSKFMKKIMKTAEERGADHPTVDALVFIFEKQFQNATNLLVSKNLLNEAKDYMMEFQKWAECLEIVEKYDHPNIDQIKADYYKWLVDNNEYDKAAALKEKEGDYETAINHYLNGGYSAKAAQVIKTQGAAKFSNTLVEQIISSLTRIGVFEKVGELCEELGQHQRALDAYREANCYDRAVAIARKHIKDKAPSLEGEWGEYLMSQKLADKAIDHFLQAGDKSSAINACIQARKWDRAIELCDSVSLEISSPFYAQIGQHFAKQRKYDLGEKYFIRAKEPVMAFHMHIKAGHWERAESVVKKHMNSEDFSKTIFDTAEEYGKSGKFKEAEKLFVLSGNADNAMTMYSNAKMYDDLIRVAKVHSPKYLDKIYFKIAGDLEADKNYKQAELYYNTAGKWIEAVRMYKSSKMWEDAIQVARAQGSKREINGIVKEWVAEIDYDEAVSRLLSLGLVESVIELELDKQNFSGAYELAARYAKYKLPEVHFKIAFEMQTQRKYAEAEEHYLKADQPEEAIEMYKEIGEYLSALRIARNYQPDAVPSIYFEQGKLHLQRGDYQKAEQAFVNAKDPAFLIKEYLAKNMKKAAYEFAKKYAPSIAQDIMMGDSDDKDIDSLTIGEAVDKAKMYQEAGDFVSAINIYLQIGSHHTKNLGELQDIWIRAVELAKMSERNYYPTACIQAAENLKKYRLFEPAAPLFESQGHFEKSCECYLQMRDFETAKRMIERVNDSEAVRRMKEMYMQERDKFEQEGGVSNDPISKEALDRLFQQGKYTELLEAADKLDEKAYNKYLMDVVSTILKNKNFSGACDFLFKNKIMLQSLNIKLYRELAYEILADENLDELCSLKNLMTKVMAHLSMETGREEDKRDLGRLAKIAYYQFLKFTMKRDASKYPQSLSKISLALISYGDVIKLDLALYDAGLFSKDIGDNSNAFIVWNRYLDYYSAIAEQEEVDEFKEFDITDIPQQSVFLSTGQNCISEQEKEATHQWLIKKMVDTTIKKALTKAPCPQCQRESWEYNKVCIHCQLEFELCVVTGYPIHLCNEVDTCTNCARRARRDAWKEWINNNGNCPNCNSVQGTSY